MLELLHGLTVKGLAQPEELADAIGWSLDDVVVCLDALRSDGLVGHREGRISGWAVTSAGRAERDRLLRTSLDGPGRVVISEIYERFLPLNSRFKELCMKWQERVPGDDTAVPGLMRLHPEIRELLAELGGVLPRFAHYDRRLSTARDRLAGGDSQAFTAPRRNSYHDVWMELHTDLLATLGRVRSAADGA